MAPESPYGKLAADQIVPALPKRVWFNSVGMQLGESEREDCDHYLACLGAARCSVSIVGDWEEAVALWGTANWYAPWLENERKEERRLYAQAASNHSPDTLLLRLANLMHGSSELFLSPASVACARAGVMDTRVANSAAGAAAQSLHQYGLASITGQGDDHMFATKFRLFLAGRWPLCVTQETFYIF